MWSCNGASNACTTKVQITYTELGLSRCLAYFTYTYVQRNLRYKVWFLVKKNWRWIKYSQYSVTKSEPCITTNIYSSYLLTTRCVRLPCTGMIGWCHGLYQPMVRALPKGINTIWQDTILRWIFVNIIFSLIFTLRKHHAMHPVASRPQPPSN